MNFHFKLRFGNITVSGIRTISSAELDRDLIQRMIDTERFLELVLQRDVSFEVTTEEERVLRPISINHLDVLLDQDRKSR